MTNKKVTRRALLMSVTSLLICISMLLGTTFAWFTDEVTSGVNQIVAGNLDVELTHKSASVTTAESVASQTNLFRDKDGKEMLWEPGAMTYETFTVKNEGNLALKYQLSLSDIIANPVVWGNSTSIDDQHDLREVVKVGVIPNSAVVSRASIAQYATEVIGENTASKVMKTASLEAGASETFTVAFYWEPGDNDNLYNLKNGGYDANSNPTGWRTFAAGDIAASSPLTIKSKIKLLATQYTSESDSFDNQYDANATTSNNTQLVVSSATAPVKNGEDTTLTVADVATATVKSTSTLSNSVGNIDSSKLSSLTLEVEKENSNEAVIAIKAGDSDSEVMGFDVSLYATTVTTFGTESTSETSAVTGSSELIVATINIGAGKNITAVYHRNIALTSTESITDEYYTYDSATGILTLYVKSFSPFAVVYTVPVTGITLDETAEVSKGGTLTLTATVLPEDAANNTVTWSSSNTGVATVDNGVVTGVAEGTATITATATNGTENTSDDYTATCTVMVTAPSAIQHKQDMFNKKVIEFPLDTADGYLINNTGTYQLGENITGKLMISGNINVILDLNGYKIQQATNNQGTTAMNLKDTVIVKDGARVTIMDRSTKKTGKILNTHNGQSGGFAYALSIDKSEVRLESGTIEYSSGNSGSNMPVGVGKTILVRTYDYQIGGMCYNDTLNNCTYTNGNYASYIETYGLTGNNINSLDDFAMALMLKYADVTSMGTFTIKGGHLKSANTDAGIVYVAYGEVTINDANAFGTDGGIMLVGGKVNYGTGVEQLFSKTETDGGQVITKS